MTDLDLLAAALRSYVTTSLALSRSRARRWAATDPDQYYHALDGKLDTLVGKQFKHDEVQAISRSGGRTRLQFIGKQSTRLFFLEAAPAGTVEFLTLDEGLKHMEAAQFPSIAAAIAGLGDLTAGMSSGTASATAAGTGPRMTTPSMSAKDATARWAEIAAAVKGARGKPEFTWPVDLTLRLTPGHGIVFDHTAIIHALRASFRDGEGESAPPIVVLLRAVVEPTALAALGAALARTWAALEKKSADRRWLLDAAVAVGDDEAAAAIGGVLWSIRLVGTAHALTATCIAALAVMDALGAAHELYGMAEMPSRYAKRRGEAWKALVRMAGRRRWNVDTLIVCAVPAAPIGAHAERVRQVQARRLERMMVDGIRLSVAEVRRDFLAHPLVAALFAEVVLIAVDAKGSVVASFMARGGRFINHAEQPVAVAEAAQIGIAHPLELADALAPWQKAIKRWQVVQPFAQLGRSLHHLTVEQAAGNVIRGFTRFDREWLHEQEWTAYNENADYMADADTFTVHFARDGKDVEAKLDGVGEIWGIVMGRAHLDYHGAKPSDPTPFGALHPVSQSELLYAFQGKRWKPPVYAGADGGSAKSTPAKLRSAQPTSAKARSTAAGAVPYAERAPTGRASCLVCAKRIDKDAVRVAVEREIATDAFTGTSIGYLHAACAAKHHAIADLADADAVIAGNSAIPWPPVEG